MCTNPLQRTDRWHCYECYRISVANKGAGACPTRWDIAGMNPSVNFSLRYMGPPGPCSASRNSPRNSVPRVQASVWT